MATHLLAPFQPLLPTQSSLTPLAHTSDKQVLTPFSFDASGAMADASGAFDASGAMASGPSCFTIEFNDGSLLKEGQTVFVSYNGGGGLVDSNENSN